MSKISNRIGLIAGVDEVGRGSLFGPVFAGAVILNNNEEIILLNEGLRDSKKLSASRRSILLPRIKELSHAWAIGQASANEIDSMGIRKATEKAMVRALHKIPSKLNLILVDGILPIKLWEGPQINLVRGESKSASIAAASILAKESRDQLIRRLAKKFPHYQLENNVGYGTYVHREALRKHGKTFLHRESFLKRIIN